MSEPDVRLVVLLAALALSLGALFYFTAKGGRR